MKKNYFVLSHIQVSVYVLEFRKIKTFKTPPLSVKIYFFSSIEGLLNFDNQEGRVTESR